jgi:D-alanyl-lipoteichoic acid acyltransferase DltB (MBOAT superfamily)
LGLSIESYSLYIILPIGISFYTFHGLSYLIDVYNNKIKAEASIINYALFVSFFPLLVAGPIERATHLLPQINNKRIFSLSNMSYGLRQMLWGFFKKIVIADNCAEYANTIFNNYSEYSGSTLLLGAFLFTVQIYCDFSGYSDIAIGVAKLLGIDLIKNFSFPYFSKNISEFWRRWHISLSSWFKDYVYIPLGGNKVSKIKQISNTFIVFIISGFWHGAEWKYIFWGALNALFVVPAIVFRSKKKNMDKEEHIGLLSKINLSVSILITFLLTMMMWIFFRAENIQSAILYLRIIFSKSFLEMPNFTNVEKVHQLLLLILGFFIVEWFGRKGNFALERLDNKFKLIVRWFIYYCLIFLIFLFSGNGVEFIYFQF